MTFEFALYRPHPFNEQKLVSTLSKWGFHLKNREISHFNIPSNIIKPLVMEPEPPLWGKGLPKAAVEGFGFCRYLGSLSPKPLLLITGLYLVTFEPEDQRDHGRTFVLFDDVICVSTWGILEAPAKDRKFYIAYQAYKSAGVPDAYEAALEQDREALRLSTPQFEQALFFVCLQALMFYVCLAEPCKEKLCLFYIARWQRELRKQAEKIRFCKEHEKLSRQWRNKE